MKLSKFLVVAVMALAIVGCNSNSSSNGTSGDNGGLEGGYNTNGVDGQDVNGEGLNGLTAEEVAALRNVKTFYFLYDSSDLQPDAMRALDVHAHDLINSGAHAVLEGHTDERGTREYNMALGERRAYAVKRYLTLQGVNASQIEVVSYGKERPAVQGHDESSWSQNRRVELRME